MSDGLQTIQPEAKEHLKVMRDLCWLQGTCCFKRRVTSATLKPQKLRNCLACTVGPLLLNSELKPEPWKIANQTLHESAKLEDMAFRLSRCPKHTFRMVLRISYKYDVDSCPLRATGLRKKSRGLKVGAWGSGFRCRAEVS